jgi:hypothetical protein
LGAYGLHCAQFGCHSENGRSIHAITALIRVEVGMNDQRRFTREDTPAQLSLDELLGLW